MEKKTLLVMGSGGDAPGMNPALRSVVRCWRTQGDDHKVIFSRGGFNGLKDFKLETAYLDRQKVAGILQRGGCEIGAGRFEKLKEKDSPERETIKNTLLRLRAEENLKGVVVIGGNGSFTGMVNVIEEECYSLTVGIPATIDNDIWGTDLSLGVDTALNTAIEIIDKIRDTALAFGRPFVVELMGRECGFLALAAAIATEAEAVFLPENEVCFADLVALHHQLDKLKGEGLKDAVIIVAEGSELKSDTLQNLLTIHLKINVRSVVPGFALRGGSPSAMDRLLGCRFGYHAVESLKKSIAKNANEYDVHSSVVALKGTTIETKSNVQEILKKSGKDTWKDQPMFHELQRIQGALSMYQSTPEYNKNVGTALLVIHGPDAPGINAAIRAFSRVALQPAMGNAGGKRFRTIAVRDGFKGLSLPHSNIEDYIAQYYIELSWRNTVGLTLAGGVPTMLSQDSIEPIRASTKNWLEKGLSLETAVKQMVVNIQNFVQHEARIGQMSSIDILVVIGGRDAFEWIRKLQDAGFYLPIIFIPASIDNDLGFTDYTIGFDTAVNNAIKAIDKIKETALAEGRTFLIETMGGLSGFLPLTVGLATGAENIIFPELFKNGGPKKEDIQEVAKRINQRFKAIRKTQSILIFHEHTVQELGGIDAIAQIFEEEQTGSDTSYGVRKTVLGYTLRGGHPTAFDRILASRLGAAAAFGIADVLKTPSSGEYRNGFAVGLDNNEIKKIGFVDLIKNNPAKLKHQQERMRELATIHCSLANDRWMETRLKDEHLFTSPGIEYDASKKSLDMWRQYWGDCVPKRLGDLCVPAQLETVG